MLSVHAKWLSHGLYQIIVEIKFQLMQNVVGVKFCKFGGKSCCSNNISNNNYCYSNIIRFKGCNVLDVREILWGFC